MDNINKHEFSEVDNVLFNNVAKYFLIAGLLIVGLNIWDFNTSNPISIIIDSLEFIAGFSFILASLAFKKISHTEGDDIMHLLNAIQKVKTSMLLYVIVYVIIVVLRILIQFFLTSSTK